MKFIQPYLHAIRLLLFCTCIFLSSSVKAQQITKNLRINDSIKGVSVFEYAVIEKDTIYNGSFKFNATKKTSNQKEITSYNYVGNFKDDKKTGEWVFSKKEAKLLDDLKEEEYSVTFNTTGQEFKIIGNFNAGLADGNWQVVNQFFENASPTDTLYHLKAKFENAILVNHLTADYKQVSIIGDFNEKGLLNGDWEITHHLDKQELLEVRTYENGIFKAHYFLIDNAKYPIEHKGLDTTFNENENWVDFEISEAYFEIFELSNIGFEVKTRNNKFQIDLNKATSETNQYVKNALLSFGYLNNYQVWSSLKGNQAIQYGKFKVRKFPFSKQEENQLKEITKQTTEAKKAIKRFFSNPNIEVGKVNYKELNQYEAILRQYQKALPKWNTVVDKMTQPAFEFIIRKEVVPNFDLSFDFDSEVRYSYQGQTIIRQHSFPEAPKNSELNINSIHQFIGQLHSDVLQIESETERILIDLTKQEALNEYEEELVNKKAELQALFNNEAKKDSYNTYHEAVSEELIAYSNQVFFDYINLPVDQKKNQVQSTLNCIEELINSYQGLANIPRKLERLDDVYTRTSFNPFVMVDMSERIKENIYVAFEKYLFPSLLSDLRNNISCDAYSENLQYLEKIYNRMVELSDQDTSIIEKELKRERDLEEIKRILLK
jgi:hypothetical protein